MYKICIMIKVCVLGELWTLDDMWEETDWILLSHPLKNQGVGVLFSFTWNCRILCPHVPAWWYLVHHFLSRCRILSIHFPVW
jgi:hypothetical protein